MTSALVLSSEGPDAPPLADDLEAAGIDVLGTTDCAHFVQDAIRGAPDLVICFERTPDARLFDGAVTLGTSSPRPFVVFTSDPDAEKIVRAMQSGIHAYVVNGYSLSRLRSVIHVAQARFRREQVGRLELAEVTQRFAERKLVDRAKGILMGARQLREEEAFRVLRGAAMASKQRIGQVSQLVIDQARYAEAMNRAGQLRMLSQRLVSLYALCCADVPKVATRSLFAASVAQTADTLAFLDKTLSAATFGDLVAAVSEPWRQLRAVLDAPPSVARLGQADDLAEAVLLRAERLTANLEVAAFATALRVINVAGRQRMLSQRLAKEALLDGLRGRGPASPGRRAGPRTRAELVEGFAYLEALPLTNAEIARELAAAGAAWAVLEPALAEAGTDAGRARIAAASEALLTHFDRLTDQLERGVQALIG